MRRPGLTLFICGLLGMAGMIAPRVSYGCAVCFGATDLSVKAGLRIAILTLLGILLGVLGGFVAFFVQMQKRAKKIAAN